MGILRVMEPRLKPWRANRLKRGRVIKMKKLSVLLLLIMVILTACGGKEQTPDNNEVKDNSNQDASDVKGFMFKYNDVTIPMNVDAEPVLDDLGESMDYFEAASCAFQGLDKVFYYSGFELSTYPQGEKDIISSVNILDDTVTTAEGIYLGSPLDKVISAYGEDYDEENGFYTYSLDDSQLTFVIENDVVTAITYGAVVEGLND